MRPVYPLRMVAAFLMVLGTFVPLYGQQHASGVVFQDQNKNGRLDEGDRGLASVAVSNGRDVVLTDEQGRYELPVGDDTIIFVIKPAGYRLPVNDRFLPQFYYIHKPAGSPPLAFDGVEPTGPLPGEINFPMMKTEVRDNFKALVFGDPQPYTAREVAYFDRDIVSELAGAQGYDFGISLGDLVGDDLDLFDPYTRSVARVGIPWFNVYGNHDMNYDAETDRLADETYEATFGPATYAFNHGKVHFIILDDVVYPRPDGTGGYIGGLTEQQLAFIENDLERVPRDRLVVLAFHIPLFMPEGWGRTFRVEDRDRLFELLQPFPHTLTLSAHTHYQRIEFLDEAAGWKQHAPHLHYNVGTTSGDWWSGVPDGRGIPPTLMRDGTPNGYATLSFSGNRFTIDYKAANYDAGRRMRLWGPEVVPQNSWHNAELYVNYFLGSDSTEVEYRVAGDTDWNPMARVHEQDPHVALLRQKWDTSGNVLSGKRPSNPVPSTHLWKTGVPNNLPLGEQTINIRVTDMFGREFYDSFTYEVVQPPGEAGN